MSSAINQEIIEALEPFARFAEIFDREFLEGLNQRGIDKSGLSDDEALQLLAPDDAIVLAMTRIISTPDRNFITRGDLRRARAALAAARTPETEG